VISTLFSSEFSPMRELFAWQLVGDTLKIGSWILAFLMLGKAMVKLFMITEIFSAMGFYILTYILTGILGLEGVSLAHAINYALYWIIMVIVIGKTIVAD